MNKQPEVRARTRQKMIDAFWSLSKEKNMNQISVGEMTRLAGYNRSTFYEYFTDIPDLLSQVENELLEKIRQELPKNTHDMIKNGRSENTDFFHMLFHTLNEPMYCLLGPHGDPSFFSKIKDAVAPAFSAHFSRPGDETYFDYIFSYTCSALIGLLQHWHETGKTMSEEALFQLGYSLMSEGVLGMLSRPDKDP